LGVEHREPYHGRGRARLCNAPNRQLGLRQCTCEWDGRRSGCTIVRSIGHATACRVDSSVIVMNPGSPASSTGGSIPGYPSKRARQSPPDRPSPTRHGPDLLSAMGPSPPRDPMEGGGGTGRVGQSSSFRNVSACNRCRLRKNRCDQRLPRCAACEKASVRCTGYDPITKREIPRR
jgi:hypothetical protein